MVATHQSVPGHLPMEKLFMNWQGDPKKKGESEPKYQGMAFVTKVVAPAGTSGAPTTAGETGE